MMWFLAGLALCGVGIAVLIVSSMAGGRADNTGEADSLDEVIASLDRDDPAWRMADVQRKRAVVPDSENGALTVLATLKLLPEGWPADSLNASQQDQERSAMEESLDSLAPPSPLRAAQVKKLGVLLERAERALPEARKLAQMPRGRFPVDWTGDVENALWSTPIQGARLVAALLGFDALLRTHENDLEGAMDSCRAALNCGKALGDEGTLIVQLVRVACHMVVLRRVERVLAQGEPPAAALARLQESLADEAEQPLMLFAMPGERAFQDASYQAMQEGCKKVGWSLGPDLFGVGLWFLWAARREMLPRAIRRTRAAALCLNTRCIEIARLPFADQRRSIAERGTRIGNLPKPVQVGWMAFEKVAGACRRNQAELRAAVVALALERHRQQRSQWPAQLADLVPELLPVVPIDSCDGQPLRYRRVAHGAIVYSVGLDEQDNGGKFDRDPTKPGTDRVFRLWDVPLRRPSSA